ncbi:D-lactaldehyde dehydrogenase [Cyathus striatus]|nr:D-lactaldehyde dehydrogenase [Cyathus striatus]
MPAIQPGSKVLVTGANGFLAIWAVQKLLECGYSVRGTVRAASKGTYLTEYFKGYGDRFELAIVPNMVDEGAFDKALVGVSGVLHVASPLPNEKLKDPDDYIRPAVNGTVGILKTALKSSDVKRIVYTSTIGTIMRQVTQPTTLSEKDWNEGIAKIIEEQGAEAPNVLKYITSKVIAEKAAWELYEKHKASAPYDLVVLNAPWILGPPIHELGSEPSSLGLGSLSAWYNNCIANPDIPRADETLSEAIPWADVRDLADGHVNALEKVKASGERILVSAGMSTWQQWIDALNKVQPLISLSHHLPKGKPGIEPIYRDLYDTSKEARILGTKFREVAETASDMLEFISKKDW